MEDRLIIPNFHVVLVHYPLALLLLGTAIELFAFLWPKNGVRTAGRWMILIGALSMLPAAASGMYAFSEATEVSDAHREVLRDHVWQAGAASVFAAVAAAIGLGCSDRWRHLLRWPLLIVFVFASALTVVGAWHAGEAVYRYGTGVMADAPATQPVIAEQLKQQGPSYLVPPLDGHLLAAGFMAAFAFAGLGLSYRRYTHTRELERQAAVADAIRSRKSPATVLDTEIQWPTRGTRFWALGTLLAVVTAVLGLWYLGTSTDAWATAMEKVGSRAGVLDRVHGFLRELLLETFAETRRTRDFEYPRRAFHFINGGMLIALMVGLTLLARYGKTGWKLLTLFSVLLLLVLAAQVWLGTLLLYDGPAGPVTAWNK